MEHEVLDVEARRLVVSSQLFQSNFNVLGAGTGIIQEPDNIKSEMTQGYSKTELEPKMTLTIRRGCSSEE